MRTNVDLTTLVPPSFKLIDVCGGDDRLEMVLRQTRRSCRCPDCGALDLPRNFHPALISVNRRRTMPPYRNTRNVLFGLCYWSILGGAIGADWDP